MILKFLLNTRMTWMVLIKKIEECNSNKKRKILIALDDMTADMFADKKTIQYNCIIYQK